MSGPRAIMGGVAALLLTAAFSGCGGDDGVSKPGEGFLKDTTSNKGKFKSTDTKQFSKMLDEMKSNMKSGHYTQRAAPKSKDKAGAGKGEQGGASKDAGDGDKPKS